MSILGLSIWLIVAFVIFIFSPTAWSLSILVASVLLPVLSIVMTLILAKRINCSLCCDSTVMKGQVGKIQIEFVNNSFLPFLNIKVEIKLLNQLTGEEEKIKATIDVPARGEASCDLHVNSKNCGVLKAELSTVKICDYFGFPIKNLKNSGFAKMEIMPETYAIHCQLPILMSDNSETEQYSPYFPGNDYSEVFQIRDYKEGDNLKQINWKLSAKTDKLVVKDPSNPISQKVIILWERSKEIDDPCLQDAMAEVLISLCLALVSQGIMCDVFWTNREINGLKQMYIQNDEDLYGAIPAILSASTTIGETVAENYLRVFGSEKYTRVIYISCKDDIKADSLCTSSNLTKIIINSTNYIEEYSELILY